MRIATVETPIRITRLRLVTEPPRQVPTAEADTACSTCKLRATCLPGDMSDAQVSRLDSLRFARRKVAAGRMLYHQGERFDFLYAVRSGTFKSTLMLADGREQVSGFYIAGEVMGLDGVAQLAHASNAVALEDSEVCAIAYSSLSEPQAGSERLQQSVSRLMSREIVREHRLMMLLGSMSADERLASFLLNLSRRLQARGYSASEFNLRMTRAEIGSYLGLTLETVSRTFSLFQKQKLLHVDKRYVRLHDLAALERAFASTSSLSVHLKAACLALAQLLRCRPGEQ